MISLTSNAHWIFSHRVCLHPDQAFQSASSQSALKTELNKTIQDKRTIEIDAQLSREFLELQGVNNQKRRQFRQTLTGESLREALKKLNQEQNKVANQRRRRDIQHYHRAMMESHAFNARILRFWSNHFSVELSNQISRALCVSYINEAIAPNVYGRFNNLLNAAILHPNMLRYLDNSSSTGPNSPHGKRRDKDINENLAREIFELHTVGVDAGYNNQDIRQLAYILSGWTFSRQSPAGTFFQFRRHEPGTFTVLGKSFAPIKKGHNQIHDVLRFLATHPSTASHLCYKLSREFVAPSHPLFKDLHRQLVKQYRKTEGNLSAVYQTLVKHPALWQAPTDATRLYKQPDEWLYGIAASIDHFDDYGWLENKMRELGKPTLAPESPAGWPSDNASWMSPEILYRQKEIAAEAARRFRKHYQGDSLIRQTFGSPDALPPHTRLALASCANKQQQFITTVMSPVFLFR
ncbi:MAG: DUF1800 family protein [Pseudomonadota bacterium]|nr:DUF1800 family protein [Pseudomonadota bacterium]